jgi:hypothetical protein
MRALSEQPSRDTVAFDYDRAIDLLVDAGLDEQQVRDGSMPAATLAWVAKHFAAALPEDEPPIALHVGNFVGVSLSAFTAALRDRAPEALVLSVDPSIPHRGIDNPQQHVLRLLTRFGLQSNSLVITGYSEARNPRDDGLDWQDRDSVLGLEAAVTAMDQDAACEQVVPNLARLLPGRLSVVLLDGNHDGEYLRTELDHVARLLRPGGMVILDDVVERFWQSIADVFAGAAAGERYESLGHDGRAGMLRRV